MPNALSGVIDALGRTGWAAQVTDSRWQLVWVSAEMKRLLGCEDEKKLGYGGHVLEAYLTDVWSRTVTPESQLHQLAIDVPFMLADTPGGKEAIARMLPAEAGPFLDELEPVPVPEVWTSELDFLQEDLPPATGRVLNIRLGGTGSERVGVVRLYGSALRASLLALVGRGDEGMFERMARLIRPARRQAAILFADLQASGALARKLSSASYFSLMRGLTTAIDDVVIEHGGIVGKHAGDGVTAFFLEEDAGSVSGAAAAAVEAGRRIAHVTDTAAGEVEGAVFNVGLHWGGTLYIGQVVTGGRIEVTALGDEVNEAARIQQGARDGALLASKPLLERLDGAEAERLGLALDELTYTTLGELPGASEKALRDAGSIAVTDLRTP